MDLNHLTMKNLRLQSMNGGVYERGQRPTADNSRKLSSSINQVPNSYSLSQGKRKREERRGGGGER